MDTIDDDFKMLINFHEIFNKNDLDTYVTKCFTRYTFTFLHFFRIEFIMIKVFPFNNNNGKRLIMNLRDQVCQLIKLFRLVNE